MTTTSLVVVFALLATLTTQQAFPFQDRIQKHVNIATNLQEQYKSVPPQIPQPPKIQKGISDYAGDLEKFIGTFQDSLSENVFNYTLEQITDVTSSEHVNQTQTYITHYENFSLGEPAVDISGVKVGFSVKYPNYDIKLSGLKFNLDFDYSLINIADQTQAIRSHGVFSVSDMSLDFGSHQDLSESVVTLGQSHVTLENGDLAVLAESMKAFLTEQFTELLNAQEDEDSEQIAKRNLFEIPTSVASLESKKQKLEQLLKAKAREFERPASKVDLDAILNQFTSDMNMKQSGRNLRAFEEEDEDEASKNFYFLLEQVYSIKLETGLENELADIPEEDTPDIFDAFDMIKQKAEEQHQASLQPVPTGSAVTTTIKKPKKESELAEELWTPDMDDSYEQVVKDLKKGNLKWHKLSNDKMKKIEKQVSWDKKLQKEVKAEIKEVKAMVALAEHDLEKVANNAMKKFGNMFNFP